MTNTKTAKTTARRALRENQWLAKLPLDAQQALIDGAKIRDFDSEHRIQSKGERADGLYGLISGEVRISATTRNGEEFVFSRLTAGQWFGEIALLDGGLRTHDAHTAGPSSIAILPRALVHDVSERHPAFYRELVVLLCSHCRLAFSAIDDFLVCSTEQRLAKRLLGLHPAPTTQIALSQQEIAGLSGLSRQSVNKILKGWEQRGWIRRHYRGIEICDYAALAELSQ